MSRHVAAHHAIQSQLSFRLPCMRLLLCSLLACLTLPAFAAPLRVVTSDLPPLSIEHANGQQGALVDIVTEVARRAGVPIEVQFVPWKRALFLVSKVPNTAIFPLTRNALREKSYRWITPLHYEKFVFVGEEGRSVVTDAAALRSRPVAVLRGSVQLENLKKQGYTQLIETTTVQGGLRLVKLGIADAVFGDQDIISGAAHAYFPDMQINISAPVTTAETWLGGSPEMDDATAARLHAAMKAVVKDGTYARLLKNYGLRSSR